MLDALVLADGATEDDALFRIDRRAVKRIAAQADGFGTDQDAFGIEAVEQITKAFAFFADARACS